MEVTLTTEQYSALERLAQATGRDKGDLLVSIAEHLVDCERRLAELKAEIQVGLDDIARGDVIKVTDQTLDDYIAGICDRGRKLRAKRKRSA